MLGEQYQVDYIINLQDNASAGIRTFSQAASKLANATKNFKQFEERFNKMTATFNKQLELKISTSQASRKLNRVIKQLEKIHNLSTGINVGVAGSAGGGATNRRVSTTQVAAPAPRPTRVSQPQGPRPIVAPRGRQPLVPRNLEYQVLGPTRLGNVPMLDMFKGMGLMYGISAIGSGVRDILSQSTEYENIMQTAMNILKTNYKGGNFNASFADMERIVREVGVETKFTAPEVADAVKFLAMAGLDINAINKSIRPIADIALIGDTDLGQTADVMTNIMTAYGIKPDDMRKTADVMTRTFTMSNTTLLELAESFKMAGSMLHLANVPFETAAAAFGVLGDAGIKATMAGTTMRTIMNNLRNPTKNQQKYWDMLGIRRYDEYGNIREINDIFADLNKLNGNDARSAEAKRRYDELQKQFAPRFEGLQEGSVEYNKVLSEYDKESEAIRKQFGGVDVFRLFRLTAASGAGVLMNSVEKWNKIIDENFLSQGLSNKLAEKKKNTIAGMWAQLKSAFQEGGLKVFEENDGIIRGYLQKGISWLKSDQFTKVLRDVTDLVVDLGGTLLRFTKIIVGLYDKFGPLIKFFLKSQLYAKGFQTILVSLKQFGNSVLYSSLPLLNLLGGRRMPVISGGNAAASIASSVGTGTAGGLLYYGIPQKLMGNGYRTLLETGSPWAAMKADPNYVKPGHWNTPIQGNLELYKRYATSNKRIQAFNRNAGWSSMAGGIAGAYLGSAIAPESQWAGAIGGVAGSLGAMALASSSIPYAGWIAAGVLAVAAGTAAIIENRKAMLKAREAALAYNEVLSKLNTSQWNVTNITELVTSSIHIENNVLLSQKEKLESNIELWKKYYASKKGDREDIMDTTEGGFLYANDKLFSSLFDQAKEHGLEFLGDLHYNRNATDPAYQETLQKTGVGWAYKEVPLFFRQYGTEKNNKAVADATDFINGLLPKIKSIEDFDNLRKQFNEKFLTPAGKMYSFEEEKGTKLENLTGLSYSELMQYPTFNKLMNYRLNSVFEQMTSGYSDFLSGRGQEGYIKNVQSQIFSGMEGGSFFNGAGFKKQFQNYIDKVQKEGNLISDQVDIYKQDLFEKTVDVFNRSNDIQKSVMLPMLNRDYWEQVLGVDLKGIEGGFNMPSKDNAAPYGDMFKWNAQKGYWEYFEKEDEVGMPSLPNWGNGTWTYKQDPKKVFDLPSVPLVYMFPEQEEPANLNKNGWFSKPAYAAPTVPMWPNGIPVKQENPVPQDSTLMNVAREFTNTSAMLANANVEPWREAVDRISYKAPWEPVTREEVDRATTEPLYAAFAPSYTPFMPPLSQPAASNEAFRPAERQQVAMVARPVVININAERLVDFGTLNIDNATDDEEIAQKVRNALEGILAEVAESTGGNYNYGVSA